MSVYISEYNVYSANGGDFAEIVAPAGTDVSGYTFYAYEPDGTIRSGPYSLGSPVASENGVDVYVIDQHNDGMEISTTSGLALVDDTGNVTQFLSQKGTSIDAREGPAHGQTSTQTVQYQQGKSVQSDDGGKTYYRQSSANRGSAPCFAAGTRIATPHGPRAVEDLAVGDLVLTLSGAVRPVAWACFARADAASFARHGHPVSIRAGSLGPGRPARDLIVSPQHRILVGEGDQLTQMFRQARLVPAKALTDLPGIRYMFGKTSIVWHHFACHGHQIVLANGCAAESLYPGSMVLAGLPRAGQAVLSRLLADTPHHAAGALLPFARPCLTVGDARRRIESRTSACV